MNQVIDSKLDILQVLQQCSQQILGSSHFDGIKEDFKFNEECLQDVVRLPGASNVTYKITFKIENKLHSVVYRKFKNKLVDFRIENLIFEELSRTGLGPYWYYQCKEYRFEEYIPSRTVSIFELRNPGVMKQIVTQFAEFHHNKKIQTSVMDLLKSSEAEPKTCLESFLCGWWKDIKSSKDSIEDSLTREDYHKIFDEFTKMYFFDGFEDYWLDLLPTDGDKVIAHTDAQETNLLMQNPSPGKKASCKVMIIDYEYAGLVERSWDLANYYTETMLSNCEYDSYPWVELFEDNQMHLDELKTLVRCYVDAVQNLGGPEIEYDKLLSETKKMIVAINYYWGAWAIVSLDIDKINEDDLYFPAAKHRMRLIEIGMQLHK